MGQGNGQGHVFRGFIGGIPEHHALVTGTDFFRFILGTLFGFVRFIHPLGNVRRLFIDGNQHPAGGTVKAVLGPVIADIDHRLAGDLGNVHIAAGGNFPYNMDLAGGHQGFAGNPGIRVLFQDSVQHRIRNLIGDFVRMAFRNGFRRKYFFHCFLLAQKKYSQNESTYRTLILQSTNRIAGISTVGHRPWLLWFHRAIPSATLDELYSI